MRIALFWVITQRVAVIPYDVSGQNSGPFFKGQESKTKAGHLIPALRAYREEALLTLWRRNYYFFLILAHPVYKMWTKQEPNKLELWNKLHFEEKNGEYRACLKYSVPMFVE